MGQRADLHNHTTASDGRLSPAAMVRWAKELGLAAIGICDHDTVAGLAEAEAAAAQLGVEVVPGVELNCEAMGHEVHILGYYTDRTAGPLLTLLEKRRAARTERIEAMVRRLNEHGIAVEFAAVQALATGTLGRPHLAVALAQAGYAPDPWAAFEQFLKPGRPGYVPRSKLDPREAVEVIRAAGGVAVLAHPGLIGDDAWIERLVGAGLQGLEAFHSEHTPEQAAFYQRKAEALGLLVTAGSDSHGETDRRLLGTATVPLAVVSQLKRLAGIN